MARNGKSNHGEKRDPAPSRRGFLSYLGAAPALKGVAGAAMLTALDAPSALAAGSTGQQDRTHLPMPNTGKNGLITFDAKDPASKFPPIDQLRPPKGAPNVLLVLIDDAGFGSSSAFGGPCRTPNFENLATDGVRFTRFHTTALCSPTRQALLTGRNHHSAGMGGITEIATGAPGYNSVLPNSMSPLARTLPGRAARARARSRRR